MAPDGGRWAGAWAAGVRVFDGDRELATYAQRHNAAGSIGFSPDSGVGLVDLDAATGAVVAQPPIPALAAFAASSGRPAPPGLSAPAARKSEDGSLVVVAATGVTRDRTKGLRHPATGDSEWLIALDGKTRAPATVLWSSAQPHNRIAIGPSHIAAGGLAGLHVFDRDVLTTPIDLGLRGVIGVALSADGGHLAAIGDTRTVAIWRTGTWQAPLARFEAGTDYLSAVAFHPTRPLLAVGSRARHLRIYPVTSALAAPLADLDVGGEVHALAFTPDGASLLASVGHPLAKLLRFGVAVAV